MNAVILAGGFGSRLRPLTDTTPKPMLPIANQPMIDFVISHLVSFGVHDIVFTLGYFPEKVTAWVDGYKSVVPHYVVEDVPLGTAGGVKAAFEYLDDNFIVVSGDALENVDYAAMTAAHVSSGRAVTMAVTHVSDARPFGLVEISGDLVTKLTEKPANLCEGIVNCGVYIIRRSVLERIPPQTFYDFSRDFFPALISEGEVGAYFHDGYWSDIGSPSSYYEANFSMKNGGFYPRIYNRFRTVSHKLGGEEFTLAAYSALVTGRCRDSIVCEGAAISSGGAVDRCLVMPGATVRGTHYSEIVGEDFSISIAPTFVENPQVSTQIYKNFS